MRAAGPPDMVTTRRVATIITEVTSPAVLAPALLIAVALRTELRQHHHALAWGLLAAVFVGALPLAFLKVGARRGRWQDHHVHRRELRAIPLAFAACSVALGIALLLRGHAPQAITALVVAMLAGLLTVLVVSHWWKVSIHSAVAGGTAFILWDVFGPLGLVTGVLILTGAGWSRIASRNHTVPQVVIGSILGATAALLYLPLR